MIFQKVYEEKWYIECIVEQRKRLIESMQIVAQKEEFNIARTDNDISKLIEKYKKDLVKVILCIQEPQKKI